MENENKYENKAENKVTNKVDNKSATSPENNSPSEGNLIENNKTILLKKQIKKKNRQIIALSLALFLGINLFIFYYALNYQNYILFQQESLMPGNNQATTSANQKLNDRDALRKINNAISYLKDNYYEEKSTEEIVELFLQAGLENMGNRFTRYLNQETFAAFLDSIRGTYYGIGVSLTSGQEAPVEIPEQEFRGYEIFEVTKNSPAEKTGLQSGDYIIEVNGKNINNFPTTADLGKEVKGKIGTTVELKIYRPSAKKILNFEVVRDEVKQTIVESKIIHDIGYIRIYSFTENLPQQFKEALQVMKEKKINKIVFDMRFNGGGDAEALKQVLDELLPKGEIATIVGRERGNDYEEVWQSTDKTFFDYDVKYAAIVNKYTASASEFFVGALRDRLNMPLFGETTYGKGVATTTIPLFDNSALAITTFEYILPKGEKLDGKGLLPTYPITMDDDVDPSKLLLEDDAALQAALAYLAK